MFIAKFKHVPVKTAKVLLNPLLVPDILPFIHCKIQSNVTTGNAKMA